MFYTFIVITYVGFIFDPQAIKEASESDEDKECLIQADGLLQALKARLSSKIGNIPQRRNWLVILLKALVI